MFVTFLRVQLRSTNKLVSLGPGIKITLVCSVISLFFMQLALILFKNIFAPEETTVVFNYYLYYFIRSLLNFVT